MTRQNRDNETREAKERKKEWVNPNQLLDPDPRDGLSHRWVRTDVLGHRDVRNVSMKFREGWEPCPAHEYPEFAEFANESNNQIEYGGLILCRMPNELVDQRNAYFQRKAQQQIEAVDRNMMRESDPRVPWLSPERSSREEFGEGKPPRR